MVNGVNQVLFGKCDVWFLVTFVSVTYPEMALCSAAIPNIFVGKNYAAIVTTFFSLGKKDQRGTVNDVLCDMPERTR